MLRISAYKLSCSGYCTARLSFIGAWLLLTAPWLFGGTTIPYDAKAHFQAQIQFLANAIHSGQSPFWSPNIFVGSPHIADPQSLIFSPAFLLAYFEAVPTFRELDAYVLILLALAGLAFIQLFQDRNWHPAGAVLAAIAVSFGASAAWRIQHIGQIRSYAFFCISFWLVDRALRRESAFWGAMAGLAIGLMLVEPDQVSMLGAYLLAGHVLAEWSIAGAPWQKVRRTIRPLASAAVATVLVAGIPLVLTILFVLASNRPAIAFEEAVRGSLHPVSLLTAVVGDLFGALDPRVEYWGPYSESWNPRELTLSQNMSQLYLGALPALLLLTIGMSRRMLWEREVRGLTVSAVVMLVYALGSFTPLFAFLYRYVPGVALFRRPADATFLLGAVLAILVGYLASRWLSKGLPERQRGWLTAKIIVIGGAFLAALLVAMHENKLTLAHKPILIALIWLTASVVVFRTIRLRAITHPTLVTIATAAFMAVDLAANNGPNGSTAAATADYEVLDPRCKNETIRFLKERVRRTAGTQWRDRIEMVGLGFEWPNSSMVHGFEHTLGYNPLRMDLVSRALGAGDHIAGPDQRRFSPMFPSYRSTLANMLGLRFIASSVPIEKVDPHLGAGALPFVARTRHAYIYENPDVLPRVQFLQRVMPVEFGSIVAAGHWPEFDPKTTVLLDQGDVDLQGLAGEAEPADGAESSARITRYENTIVEVEVVAAGAGFLVLNDAWHPWWAVEIDGEPAVMHKANVMFRAVRVPAGRHRVVFEFRPFSGAVTELRGSGKHGR